MFWLVFKIRRFFRRSFRVGRVKLFFSDEECFEEDLLKRSRRSLRFRKFFKVGVVFSLRVDVVFMLKFVDIKVVFVERGRLYSLWVSDGEGFVVLVSYRFFEYKLFLVFLDVREYEWIVKFVSGFWI